MQPERTPPHRHQEQRDYDKYAQNLKDPFTTITTNHIYGTPTTIEQRQVAIDALYRRFAPPVTETSNQNTRLGVGAAQH